MFLFLSCLRRKVMVRIISTPHHITPSYPSTFQLLKVNWRISSPRLGQQHMEPGIFDPSIRPTKSFHGCCCECSKRSHREISEKSEKSSQFHTSGHFKYHLDHGYGGSLFAKAFVGCFFRVSWISRPQNVESSRVVKQRMKFCYLASHGWDGLGYNFWDGFAATGAFWFSTQCQFGLGIGNLGKDTGAFDAGNCPNCCS